MKFPNLPAATTLSGLEIVPLTQGGVDKRSTVQDIANMAAPDAFNVAFSNSAFTATNVEDAILEVSGGGGAVDSVNGQTGVVVLDAVDVGAATAAQGGLADSALQPADVGTASAEDVGFFATAAQGALADSATQPADSVTTLNMATARLLGRSTGSAGAVEEITLGTNLSFTGTTLNAAGGGGGATDFTDLGDVPASYSGAAGQVVAVNATEDGLEFITGGGGGGSTIGPHQIPIMAGAIQPSVSGGSSAVTAIASAAGQPDIVTTNFNQTTQQYAQFAIPMPNSWNKGTITAVFNWSHPATTVNFGVCWGLQAVAVSDDDPIAVAFGTAQEVVDTGGTTNDLYVTSATSAITVAGSPADGDTVFFRVYRNPAHASDNMAVVARLHSVVLTITTDADTDA